MATNPEVRQAISDAIVDLAQKAKDSQKGAAAALQYAEAVKALCEGAKTISAVPQ